MLPITSSNSSLSELQVNQELLKYNVNSFLDLAVEKLMKDIKSLQEIEKNELKIRNYEKNQKCYDFLCCSIPKLICALPITCGLFCYDRVRECRAEHYDVKQCLRNCCDGDDEDDDSIKEICCGVIQYPWWRSWSIHNLESRNCKLREGNWSNAKDWNILNSPLNSVNQLSNFEVKLAQVMKMTDPQSQPLIFDYLERIHQYQHKIFLYDDKWYHAEREDLVLWPESENQQRRSQLEARLFNEKYSPMINVLLNESFLASFELTIQLRSSSRDILIQVGLPKAVIDNILLGYIGIPTAEEKAKEKAAEEKFKNNQNDYHGAVTFHV